MIDYLKNRINGKFFLGGICAVLLPFIIGVVLLAIPIIAGQDPSCHYGSKNTSIACDIYQEFGGGFYWLIMLPIILSFIFITPLIAAISIAHLEGLKQFSWREIFMTGIAKSTKVNFWVAFTYNIIAFLILIAASGGMAGSLGSSISFLISISMVQFGLWLCITLPLALICSGIFGIVVRPSSFTQPQP